MELVEYVLKGTMEQGKASEISSNEVIGIPNIPPTAHVIATILRFRTTYELVDWLAKRLLFSSYQMVQEHKDGEMIQRAMIGALEPEEESESQKIG